MAEEIVSLVGPVASAPGLHYLHPRSPLNVKLPESLECGTALFVHGAVAAEADRFSLNLRDAEADANTLLHFNPRFGPEAAVVRNSRIDEAWGEEDREGGNPFAPGRPFLLAITATVDGYEVEVDGAPFTVFAHRAPLCSVTHVTVGGDVVVYGLHVPLAAMPIPLELRMPGKVGVGDIVCITGAVPDGAQRFAVNLQCGGGADAADVALHLNPRLEDGVLVANSRTGGDWGEETRCDVAPLASRFVLRVAAARDAFRVFEGDAQLLSLEHRLLPGSACTLRVDGDVRLEAVTVASSAVRLPHHLQLAEDFEEKSAHDFFPAKPSILEVPESFGPGKVVHVSATIDDEATRFHVNLQSGDAGEGGEVALHVNPRFEEDGAVLVLNTFDGGAWGEEERVPLPLLRRGAPVDLHVLCAGDGFVVAVDGERVAHFPHRLDPGAVSHVLVDGDLAVAHVFAT